MNQQKIGRFSLWVFLASVAMIYVSSPTVHHVAHNFDYRSYVEWETHSTNAGVTSKSEEQLTKEHALKGKDIPSLALLLRSTITPPIKTKGERKIVFKPDVVIEKDLSVESLNTKVKKPLLIPNSNHKMIKERSFEANRNVGLQTDNNTKDEESKNLSPPSPPKSPTIFRTQIK